MDKGIYIIAKTNLNRPKAAAETSTTLRTKEMVMVLNRWRSRAKMLKHWRELPNPECSPFDAKGTITYGFRTLREIICNDGSPCCSLVTLYAKMGLHRYNLIQGKNYKLDFVEKYHFRWSPVPSPYYITLVARDPSASLPQTFQTLIAECEPAGFVLKCNIARIRGETNKYDGGTCYNEGSMPEWPTENPFENGNLFYVLNNSELEDNEWIRLYLELAVAKIGSSNKDPDLSNLKIVNVAMDTRDLNAKNATVYISYKDSCEARVGKDVDRIAMVRRTFGERTGCFSVMGKHQSSELIPKKGANHWCDGNDVRSSFHEHTGCLSPMDYNLILEKKRVDTSCEAGVGKDVDRIRSSFNECTRCLSPMDQNLSSGKKCKDPQSEDESCEAGVGKDVDSIRSSFNERTRCLSPMDQNLSSGKKCKDPQSEDDSCEAGVGKDVDRIRSSFNERTRCLSPMDQNLSSGKKCKYQRAIRRLGVLKPWRFLSPRRHKAYKNRHSKTLLLALLVGSSSA